MTEIGESVAVPGMPSNEQEEKLTRCEWKTCNENHESELKYPKDGDVSRNSSYESDWVSAKLEPWDLYGAGTNSRATLEEYREETPAAKYAATAAAMKHPEYHTQKHHLISVNLFGGVGKLAKNAELIGYDVNHKNNGICLPSYIIDIVQHDLQCHRGSHPKALYNDKINPLLKRLQSRCLNYCELDINGNLESQKKLIDDLNRLSRRIEGKIKSWDWLLRKNAKKERVESNERYNNLNKE